MVAYTKDKVRLCRLYEVYRAAKLAIKESEVREKTDFKLPRHDGRVPLIDDPTREAKTYRFTLRYVEVPMISGLTDTIEGSEENMMVNDGSEAEMSSDRMSYQNFIEYLELYTDIGAHSEEWWSRCLIMISGKVIDSFLESVQDW